MMNPSRAGLCNASYATLLTAAALLLSLSAVVAQSVPVPTSSLLSGTAAATGGIVAVGVDSSVLDVYQSPYEYSRAAQAGHSPYSYHAQEYEKDGGTEIVTLVKRKSLAAKIRAAFHKIGHAIKHAFKKVGEKIVHAAKAVGHAIKHAAQKVASGVKKAVKKVGHFIKTTGAKIAKVALKVVATAQKLASKVVGWIPGVGKPLARVMDAESEGLNKASDAIHVKLGGKLGKAMNKMDKIQKVAKYIP